MVHIIGRQLIKNKHFLGIMSEHKSNAWPSFKAFGKNFLRNTCIRAENYTRNVQKLLQGYKSLSCSMSIRLDFVYGHLHNFRKSLVTSVMSKVNDSTKM